MSQPEQIRVTDAERATIIREFLQAELAALDKWQLDNWWRDDVVAVDVSRQLDGRARTIQGLLDKLPAETTERA